MMEASIVAKSFRFAADMLSIANRVIANLKAHGGETYHGIHLRLEGGAVHLGNPCTANDVVMFKVQ